MPYIAQISCLGPQSQLWVHPEGKLRPRQARQQWVDQKLRPNFSCQGIARYPESGQQMVKVLRMRFGSVIAWEALR